jgi:hypothetical protein
MGPHSSQKAKVQYAGKGKALASILEPMDMQSAPSATKSALLKLLSPRECAAEPSGLVLELRATLASTCRQPSPQLLFVEHSMGSKSTAYI